ncbi:uncharacterized protein LOC129598422 [Paramacrobiotus metropolitanus]|uniref:uncharacterized protein LOC129598422 n=1 Tax=Paramacrobiotus metropolitanus TaxID=2943436 RepID=UPI0024465320|nr:uncharacterized protein LOC129598422 [Paramacrobiotus metropolitanus]
MHRLIFRLISHQPSFPLPFSSARCQCVNITTNASLYASESKKDSSDKREPLKTSGRNPNEDSKASKKESATRSSETGATSKASQSMASNETKGESKPPASKDYTASSSSKSSPTSQSKSSSGAAATAAGKSSAPSGSAGRPKDGKIRMDDYKVQEYFQHNLYTFYDVEKSMVSSRLPQPSSNQQEQAK